MNFFSNPISTATLRGSVAPQLQRQTGRYSPISGWTFDQNFRGLSLVQMANLAAIYANSGCEYTLTWERGVATLETNDTRGNISIDIWEVVHQETLIPSVRNPRNVAAFDAGWLAVLAYAQETGQNATAAETAFNADPLITSSYGTVTLPTGSDDTALAFWRLWERVRFLKEDSIFYNVYSVRHTSNVSNRWPYNIAETNRGCIYTPAQFYNEVQDSSLWLFPMPDAFVNLLESNPAPDGPPSSFRNYGYYLWGFLKSGSPRVTAANNTSNIVTEYKQFLWNTEEYATL